MYTRHTKMQRLTPGAPGRHYPEKWLDNETMKGLESDSHGLDSHTKLDK